MKIQKAVVQYKDRDDIICMYGIIDDGTKEGKKLYFLGDDETKKFSNGNRVVTDALVEAVDPMIEPKHVGLIDKKGNIIIPLENRAIKPINDKMVLVEKATPVSQSVIDAVEARKGPNGASGLVATSAAIKDAMNVKMGPEGRFIFNDQFSEATVCDIDGNNLIGDQYFSYVSLADDLLYLSTNVADSEIKEFSISKKEFVEDKNEQQIDVNAVGVDPQVVNDALASEANPVVDIPTPTVDGVGEVNIEAPQVEVAPVEDAPQAEVAPVEAAPEGEITPPLGFDDFFKGEGSTMPADSVEVTDDNKEVMDLLKTAKMPATEEVENKEEGKTEEFTPEIPSLEDAMASQELGENSVPAPLAPEIPTLEEDEKSEVVTPPVVDVAAELQNITVNLDEGVHDDVIPEVADAAPEAPVAEETNEELVEDPIPAVKAEESTKEAGEEVQAEKDGSELEAVAIPDIEVSPIPEIVEKDNNTEDAVADVPQEEAETPQEEAQVEAEAPQEEVSENNEAEEVKEEAAQEEVPVDAEAKEDSVEIPVIPEVVGDDDVKTEAVEEKVENEEVAPVVEEAKEEAVAEAPQEEAIDTEVAAVVDETPADTELTPVSDEAPVDTEVAPADTEVAPVVDSASTPVEEITPVISEGKHEAIIPEPVQEDTNVIQPEDVASIVDKDANGILDSDELVERDRGIVNDDMSLEDILGRNTSLDLEFERTPSFDNSVGSNTIMDDVVKSMSELVRQNKEQKSTISSLQGRLSTAEGQRDLVADKYREQARKLELVTSKLKNLDTLTTRLEGKLKEKEKTIERLQGEITSLHDQINGKQDLVDILRDAQQLLDTDYNDNYLSKVA